MKSTIILLFILFCTFGLSQDRVNLTESTILGNPNAGGGGTAYLYGNSNYSLAGVIIGVVFGAIFLIAGLVLCIKFDKCKWPKWWRCHQYQKMKKQFNAVDHKSMSVEVFQERKNAILANINDSRSSKTFFLEKDGEKHPIQASVSVVWEKPFITKVKLTGVSCQNSWSADGYILCRAGEVFFWMYKEFDNKEKAEQVGKKQHLVYKSTKCEGKKMEGKWFYYGFSDIQGKNGNWFLLIKTLQSLSTQVTHPDLRGHTRNTSSSILTTQV